MPAFKLQLGCRGSDKKDRKLQVVVVPFATIVRKKTSSCFFRSWKLVHFAPVPPFSIGFTEVSTTSTTTTTDTATTTTSASLGYVQSHSITCHENSVADLGQSAKMILKSSRSGSQILTVGVEICDVLGVNINGIHWTSIDLLFWCFTKVGSWTSQERCKHQPPSNDPHNDHLGGGEIGGWWWLF